MNNQFATQFLLNEMDAYDTLRSALIELGATEEAAEMMVKGVEVGLISPSKAIEITKATLGVNETSSVGGGVTGGPTAATAFPGAGEQVAGAKKAFKKTYKEGTFENDEVAIFDGGEDGLTKIYKKADGSFYGQNDEFDFTAKDEQELLRKVSNWGYKLMSGTLDEDAPRLAGSPAKTNKQGSKNLKAYSSVGFTKAPNAEEAGKKIKGVQVKDLWEGQRYSQFKKEAAVRSKPQQMHEAAKMIHKKLEEVSKLLEFASLMRGELSEGEEMLEYSHNTKKVFDKIHTKVVEVFSKVKGLKGKDAVKEVEERHRPGLIVVGHSQQDNMRIGQMIEDMELHGEWNPREGYWFFPEEEDMYDQLEKWIQDGLDEREIRARIEGVFGGERKSDYMTRRMKDRY